jgi:folate-binding protein YgfZ
MFSLDEYAAAHRAAVVSDGSSTGTLVATGSDRRSFLHALLTNDISALEKGTGTYSAYLTPQGRMISDMHVIETGDRMFVGVERFVAAPLAERLDKLVFSEDVQVTDVTSEVDVVGVHGPAAGAIIDRATGISVFELAAEYRNATFRWSPAATSPVTIVRHDSFGVAGFDIYVPRDAAGVLQDQLVKAGATTAGHDTLEALRLEAGRPRFGVDMSSETIPLEAGIEGRAISFTKGCYVGQEVIVRVMHRGHGRVARRLVRLVLSGSAIPSRGDRVLAGDQQVGEVTSAAESPKAGAPIAMAYVQRHYAGPDAELSVNGSKTRMYQPGD